MAKTNGKQVNVLVVDDSAFMRRVISDILNSDPQINVMDTAKNGVEAIEKISALHPDVVTLDVEMPVMDGLTCLKEILKKRKMPIIMLSGLTKEGADATLQALENGAIDFITKPTNIFSMSGEEKKREVIEKVKMAKNTVVREQNSNSTVISRRQKPIERQPNTCSDIKYLVAIGTSTGGPRALQDVIPVIPGDAPAAFFVVQHMPAGFTKSLAERLNNLSEVTVKEAEDMEPVQPGFVYVAPGDYHMLVERTGTDRCLRIKLNQNPSVGGHRPSVNVMMNSVADTGLNNVAGVIMTGMGGDGSEGIRNIKAKNKGYIIAQDEKSCVVYGMPKVAVQTGVVDIVVPLKEITREIMNFMGVQI